MSIYRKLVSIEDKSPSNENNKNESQKVQSTERNGQVKTAASP